MQPRHTRARFGALLIFIFVATSFLFMQRPGAGTPDSEIYQYGGGDVGAVFNTLEDAEQALRESGTNNQYATAGLSFPIFSKIKSRWAFLLTLDYRPFGGIASSPPSGTFGASGTPPSFKRTFHAGGNGGPPPQTSNCGAGGPDGGSSEGDPCVASSGNQSFSENDFAYGAISFSRRYNSLRLLKPYAAINDNWSHSFAQRILTSTLTDDHGLGPSPTADYIIAQDANAHAEFYRLVTPGTSKTPGVFRSTVERGRVMTVHTIDNEGATEYEFVIHFPDGHTEHYDNAGTISRIYYPDDMHRTLVITNTIQPGAILPLIDTVTDGNGRGREIRFSYSLLPDDPYWHLTGIEGRWGNYDQLGVGLLSLEYDTQHGYHQENLLKVRRQGPSGSTVDGRIREYRYGENTPVPLPLHITSIIDENLETYATFTYDDHGRSLTSIVGGIAQGTAMDYQSAQPDRVVSATRALGGSAEYHFPAGTTDQTLRKPTYLAYRVSGAARDAAPAYSEEWTYGYQDPTCSTSDERLCRYKDPEGIITEYQYDDLHERVRIEGKGTADARRIETDYDSVSYRVSERRTYSGPTGLPADLVSRTSYSYNELGAISARCEYEVTDPTAMAYACDDSSTPPTQGVRRWVYAYCTERWSGLGNVGCPDLGWLYSTTDPEGNTTVRLYYTTTQQSLCLSGIPPCHHEGDLAQTMNSLGQVTKYRRYDRAGRLAAVFENDDSVWNFYEYAPEGWLTKQITGGSGIPSSGLITRHTYDGVGNRLTTIDPDNVLTTYTYDDAYRLTDVTNSFGGRIHYELDAAGNRTGKKVFDGLNAQQYKQASTFDTLGRVTSRKDAFDHTTVLQYAGARIQSSTDPLGYETTLGYDGLGRLESTVQNYVKGALPDSEVNVETAYAYDERDNLVEVEDPSHLVTSYGYDSFGNNVSLDSPDTGTSAHEYDRNGNRVSSTDARGVTASYGYDSLNRLRTISYSGSTLQIAYEYDQPNSVTDCDDNGIETPHVGHLTTMTDGTGSTTYCYRAPGLVTRKTQVIDSNTFDVGYGYTQGSRLQSITYPSGGVLEYGRDPAGRISSATWRTSSSSTPQTVVSQVEWYPFGPIHRIHFGDGHTLTRAADQNYAVTAITSSIATGLNLNYGIDESGQIESLTGTINGGPTYTDTPTPDPIGRLSHYTSTDSTGSDTSDHVYEYNATGDRTKQVATFAGGLSYVVDYAYAAGSHRLANVSGGPSFGTRAYNAAGATTKFRGSRPGAGIIQLSYDARNRLFRALPISIPGPVSLFGINGRGERVRKGVDGTVTYFVYDESGSLLGEYDGNGGAVAEYVWMDRTLVAVVKGGTVYYIESDHLGTPRAVIDGARQAAVWTWSPFGDPFGTNAPEEDPDGDGTAFVMNLRFPGQYFDAETGFSYNYFRDYESVTGRYVESDPVGLAAGVSTYSYSLNMPLDLMDSRGLSVCAQNCCKGQNFKGKDAVTKCCAGKAVTCTNPKICDKWGPDFCLLLKDCVERHEKLHREEHMDCSKDPPFAPENDDKFECAGWNETIKCMRLPCRSRQCKTERNYYLNGDSKYPGANNQRDRFCNRASGPEQ